MKTTSKKIDEIIRVNHAGEYGVKEFILASKKKKELKKKRNNDWKNLNIYYFDKTMLKKRTDQRLLSPIWHYGGYLLGAVTSVLGEKYVHACTEAVEEVIVDHYNAQIKYLESLGLEKEMLKK